MCLCVYLLHVLCVMNLLCIKTGATSYISNTVNYWHSVQHRTTWTSIKPRLRAYKHTRFAYFVFIFITSEVSAVTRICTSVPADIQNLSIDLLAKKRESDSLRIRRTLRRERRNVENEKRAWRDENTRRNYLKKPTDVWEKEKRIKERDGVEKEEMKQARRKIRIK